jgi:hypothetical protein
MKDDLASGQWLAFEGDLSLNFRTYFIGLNRVAGKEPSCESAYGKPK